MAEYIDRDRFADKIREHLRCSNKGSVTEAAYAAILQDLEGLPIVDVAPVVHGRWENNKNEYPECTNCRYMPAYDSALDDINYSPYCPNCGAKMDGEEIKKQREELKKKEQIMRDAQLIARDLGFVIRVGDYRTALRVVKFFGRDENK